MHVRHLSAPILFLVLAAEAALAASSTAGDRTAVIEGSDVRVLLRAAGTWSVVSKSGEPDGSKSSAATVTDDPAPNGDSADPRLSPIASAAPVSAPDFGPGGESRQLIMVLLASGAGLVLVVAGLLLYFLVIAPRKKLALLREALQIVADGTKERLDEAEELLNRAITAGLRPADIQEAYFARAYVYARRDNPNAAVADLKRADRSEPAVLYLELWALVQQERYQEAYTVFAGKEDALRAFDDGPRLMSIVCLQLARQNWKNRAIDDAIGYFERVRDLGVHRDKVPASVSDHQSMLGVLALFDNQPEEAERHFKKAAERAVKEASSGLSPSIGLLLCRWRQSEHPQLDAELTELVQRLPADVQGEAPDSSGAPTRDRSLTEAQLLARNLLLLHTVSLLHTLHHREEKSGMPAAERDELERRAARVSSIDAKMPDPKLITGLVDYYFFHDTGKDVALKLLEESGSDVPEVSLLLAREAKLRTLAKDLLKTFVSLVKDYVGDHEVPLAVRRSLLDSLDRYARFKELRGELTMATDEAVPGGGATLSGLQSRALLLRKRIGTIVKPALAESGSKSVEGLERLMTEMEKNTADIRNAAAELEKRELELMVGTGEFLLKEEPGPEQSDATANRAAAVTQQRPGRVFPPIAPIQGERDRGSTADN